MHVSDDVSDMAIKYSVSTIIQDGQEVDDPNGPDVDENQKIEASDNVVLGAVNAYASTVFSGGINASDVDAYFESDSNIGSGSGWTSGWTVGVN